MEVVAETVPGQSMHLSRLLVVTVRIVIDGNKCNHSLRHIDSFELFKSNLKTHLFKAAFINYL